uniref:Uncharacterized protein n=1 Tax=Panagrolaimus davidi TaxID=227884 RepID=A0A914QW04_9BILA
MGNSNGTSGSGSDRYRQESGMIVGSPPNSSSNLAYYHPRSGGSGGGGDKGTFKSVCFESDFKGQRL